MTARIAILLLHCKNPDAGALSFGLYSMLRCTGGQTWMSLAGFAASA